MVTSHWHYNWSKFINRLPHYVITKRRLCHLWRCVKGYVLLVNTVNTHPYMTHTHTCTHWPTQHLHSCQSNNKHTSCSACPVSSPTLFTLDYKQHVFFCLRPEHGRSLILCLCHHCGACWVDWCHFLLSFSICSLLPALFPMSSLWLSWRCTNLHSRRSTFI